MGVALYPGSFDPIHNGHVFVASQAASVFDRLIIAVAHNSRKAGSVPIDDRVALIQKSLEHLQNVEVVTFSGLTVDAADDLGADCVVKGLRNASDFDDEMGQAAMNWSTGSIQTLFVPGLGANSLVSSRFVREISSNGGDVSSVVPPPVVAYLNSFDPPRQVQ